MKKTDTQLPKFEKEWFLAFGLRLKELRTSKGYTQRQLAFESGVHFTQIAQLERGKGNPTLSTLGVLALTLDISISDLVNFENKMEKSSPSD